MKDRAKENETQKKKAGMIERGRVIVSEED